VLNPETHEALVNGGWLKHLDRHRDRAFQAILLVRKLAAA
jgi:hypothetical protein